MVAATRLNRRTSGWALSVIAMASVPEAAEARSLTDVSAQIQQMREELQFQRSLIEQQARRIEQQQREIEGLQGRAATAMPPPKHAEVALSLPLSPATSEPPPDSPVGGVPELPRVEQQAQAVPDGMGVLTRAGRFVLEPSLEYTNSSSNRLVFRGIELIPGIQVGLIEAGSADRDTLVATATARYGLTESLEIEARLPYLVRSDRTEGVQQRQDTTTQSFHLKENGIGDVEFGLRYQLNRPLGQQPIFVGSLRIKTDTGKSPFSVPFDDSGIATGLATGSGFWAVQPGLSFLLPSDPAVIFGGISYLYAIPRNVDRTVGGVLIGRVDPGDAISGNIGFGFALNPRFSFSLGYEHTYILPMRWKLDGLASRSTRLQVGTFALGMSYRLTPHQAVNFGIELGATQAAPDLGIILRMPFSPD